MILKHLSKALARLLLSKSDREFILGDLEELYGSWVEERGRRVADRRYLWAVLTSVLPRRLATIRRASQSTPRKLDQPKALIVAAEFLSDLSSGLRLVRKRPAMTGMVVLTLGLGVGASGAVFGVSNQLLFRPLPGVARSGDAAHMRFLPPLAPEWRGRGISGPTFDELRRSADLFEGMASYVRVSVHSSLEGRRPIDTPAVAIFGDYFELLGVRPAIGRLLRSDETGPDADPLVVVISERLWRTLFDRSPDVGGRSFRANGKSLRVLGVAGGGFLGVERGSPVDLWLPYSTIGAFMDQAPNEFAEHFEDPEWTGQRRIVARPRAGISTAETEAQANRILRGIAASDPGRREYLAGLDARLFPDLYTTPELRGYVRRTMGVLAAAVLLLLLVACANVAGLLLVHGLQTRSEVAVHRALGASVPRIARRRLTQSLVLASMGTMGSLPFAWLISRSFQGARLLPTLPALEGLTLNGRVVAFACVATVVTTVLFGTLPAVLVGRFGLSGSLRAADPRTTTRTAAIRKGMAAFQIALAVVLLVGGILLTRSIRNLHAVDSGFDADGVAAMSLYVGSLRYEPDELDVLYHELMEAVTGLPSVTRAALDVYGPYRGLLGGRIQRIEAEPSEEPVVVMSWVTPGWFELLGIEPVTGRTFRPSDWGARDPTPIVVTRPLAVRLFGHPDAVGRRVRARFSEPREAEIVGVVGDLRLSDLRSPPDEAFFMPYPVPAGRFGSIAILMDTRTFDAGAAAAIADAVEGVVEGIPVPAPTLLTARVDSTLDDERVVARLLGTAAGLAVLLALIGFYGVLRYLVSDQRREFGIRLALGADRRRIARHVLRTALAMISVGLAFGLVGSAVFSRVIESRLFGVDALDPATLALACTVIVALAGLACWSPVRAATRVDPARTLRQE